MTSKEYNPDNIYNCDHSRMNIICIYILKIKTLRFNNQHFIKKNIYITVIVNKINLKVLVCNVS